MDRSTNRKVDPTELNIGSRITHFRNDSSVYYRSAIIEPNVWRGLSNILAYCQCTGKYTKELTRSFRKHALK